MKIYIEDLRTIPIPGRNPGYCIRGIREFSNRYGIDFRDFLHNGIDSEIVLSTGDSMAEKIVEHAKKMRAIDG